MREVTPASTGPPSLDIFSNLPLQLIKSQIIPPAPSRSGPGSEANVDFLLDFAGHSWIAYGASSLLVISHFPNPLLEAETKIGPIYRQVIELSREVDVYVSAISWSPATPSAGELAVAFGDCIVLLTYNEDKTSSSSFCWSQTAILVQSVKVEAILWTGSGDGIISGGIEVVMWRRKEKLWEIAWSFKPDVPQALVSTTCSANGFSATAPWSKLQVGGSSFPPNDAGQCVLVFQGVGHSKYLQAELHHPMPVRMIQWRPSTGKPSSRHARHALRPVLLTCCLDGAVRLWGEIDDGRIRRTGKDNSDQKATKLSFCVVAVIEVNQTLNGFLGSDVFVSWATEVEGVAIIDGEICYYSCLEDLQNDTAGRCEWLIGFGPKRITTLWTIHCLDDFAPLRFPRVTLWKKQDLVGFEMEASQLLARKVLMMRTRVSGPPVVCSLVQLLPCNSFAWTQLYSQASSSIEGKSANDSHTESPLTACAKGVLEVEGHTGNILQIAIHPFSFEVELAASLDGNGMLLFWTEGHEERLSRLCSIALPSSCNGNFFLVNFFCCQKEHLQTFECYFSGKKYYVSLDPCSSVFPVPHNDDKVTSCGVVCPSDLVLSVEQKLSSVDGMDSCCYAYHMVTGCVNGSLKLWRSMPAQSLSSDTYWGLVGVLTTDHGLIVAVAPSTCGRKIATASTTNHPNYSSVVHIWECMHVQSSGCFMLEDKLCVEGEIVALNWLRLGNGHSLLGPLEGNAWFCIAVASALPAISDFLWGPKGILVVVHNEYFTLFSHFLLLCDNAGSNNHVLSSVFTHYEIPPVEVIGGQHQSLPSAKMNTKYDSKSIVNAESCQWMYNLVTGICFCSMAEIAEFIGGSLPIFHPEALLINLSSGLLSPSSSDKLFQWSSSQLQSGLSHFVPVGGYDATNTAPTSSSSSSRSEFNDFVESFERLYDYTHTTKVEKMQALALIDLLQEVSNPQFTSAYGSLDEPGRRYCLNFTSSWKMPSLDNTKMDMQLLRKKWVRVEDDVYNSSLVHHCLSPWSSALHSTNIDQLLFSCNEASTSLLPVLVKGNLLVQPDQHLVAAKSLYMIMESKLCKDVTKFQQLHFAKRFSRLPSVEELVASSGLIGWAFHSDCHDNLFNSLLSTEPSWEEMRSMGVGFWYINVAQLRVKLDDKVEHDVSLICQVHYDNYQMRFESCASSLDFLIPVGCGFHTAIRVMERLARQRYMKNKDPKACTLLYITLNRLQVLAGLFKISKDDKDKPLAGFLSRNFQDDKNKAAALKNAYVLMGKHQLELAIAFFLLGGDASSAVTVCAKNLGDEQLALVICRLIEGCGGPLERNLISKFLLPSALSKGDFWMASLLEWLLGNYSQSFMRMLGVEMSSQVDISVLSSSHASFLDPSIGEYCLMLATKTSMKNAVGEFNAAVLCRWAALMNVTSLSRCGLPVTLECLPSSVSLFGGPTNGSVMHSPTCNHPVEMVKPSVNNSSSNWISDEMSRHIVLHSKLLLAMPYISNLLRQHPSCVHNDRPCFGEFINHEVDSEEFEKLLKEFQDNLTAAIAYFQQKFSLVPLHLISMSLLDSIYCKIIFKFLSQENSNGRDSLYFCPSNLLLKATEEISSLYVKYVVASCENFSRSKYFTRNSLAGEGRFCWLTAWGFSNQGIARTFWCLRAMLQLFLRSYSKESLKLLFTILGLYEYHVLFASAWLQRNFKALLITVRPILFTLMRGSGAYEIKMEDLNKLTAEIMEMLAHDSLSVELVRHVEINGQKEEQSGAVPDDEIWHASASFCSSSSLPVLDIKDNNLQVEVVLVSNTLVEFLKLTCAEISFYCSKQFATYLLQEVNVLNRTSLFDLENGLSQQGAEDNYHMIENINLLDNDSKLLDFEQLWHICTDSKIIRGAFLQEYRNWLLYFKQKSSSGWGDAYVSITREFESEETWDKEDRLGSPSNASGSPLACLAPDDHPFKSSGDKDLVDSKKFVPFQNPKEIYKRNGELLEALCINSIDQCEAALASNRKGIIFFNWEDGVVLHSDKSEYIWGEADWPSNGWAGSDSIPVPTYVSPGVGLGSKKGAHLGLGGATIGAGASARPGRDLSGGPLGVPGYAGVGSSSLGWGVQESFDEFLDPPATLENVRTRAFTSHPSRPFFLVGSSNTHIYLWELTLQLHTVEKRMLQLDVLFSSLHNILFLLLTTVKAKALNEMHLIVEIATATYGVLPAAHVPPPYALASVSAVRFDHCGHRFVTAALDGTVCTWQLEVGGRSNIHPTESSVCFNNHTADVTYVTASGSIVAAAGYSSNGVNVVIWDTLAPPATSQASIMCHEGGARSLSVFDNDIGSGSISPLILTGGKGGDVGLHDFRYIATGRTKKHKHLDSGEHNLNASSSVDMRSKTGDQNRNGMLWYIPKAHSVTDIQVVSHGFLTCGGDGLVKYVGFQEASLLTTD
ncbi:hypothetical protein DH2020_006221 [Rehmannia glutinosa]|uniref:RAVE complex protein Rav1 C-terminal domain-containing protein n=1 Tax=Rehmannia glutinosa TaxID=99300 RepID=A0ABR0XIB3_REHGL